MPADSSPPPHLSEQPRVLRPGMGSPQIGQRVAELITSLPGTLDAARSIWYSLSP